MVLFSVVRLNVAWPPPWSQACKGPAGLAVGVGFTVMAISAELSDEQPLLVTVAKALPPGALTTNALGLAIGVIAAAVVHQFTVPGPPPVTVLLMEVRLNVACPMALLQA